MAYRLELTIRASRDLRRLFKAINAAGSAPAKLWFDGLVEAVLSLENYPVRGSVTPEDPNLRHLLYENRLQYRILYSIEESHRQVTVIHIRHGARRPMEPRKSSGRRLP